MEVLVKLLEVSEDNSSVLIDQQTILITENEAVFNFGPIVTYSQKLTIQVQNSTDSIPKRAAGLFPP